MPGVEQGVALRVESPLAWITLSRPQRLNALDGPALAGLVELARRIDALPEVHGVVLEADGGDFCAGADLRLPSGSSQAELIAELRRRSQLGGEAIAAVRSLRMPSVAAVRGRAIGGGFLLAAACDFCVASEDAVFSLPEVDLGIPVGWGGVELVVDVLGARLARELILTCRALSADEAQRAGLVSNVTADAELDEAAGSLARALAGKPAGAVERTKRQFDRALGRPSSEDVDLVCSAVIELVAGSSSTPLAHWHARATPHEPPAGASEQGINGELGSAAR